MGAVTEQRAIAADKATRIVDAMRSSIARRGVAGSTFDVVAREAGVSRGLLHYYFGSKERLLADVVRRDCELRMTALDRRLADAHSAGDVVDALVASLEGPMHEEPELVAVFFELLTLSRRNDELAQEFAELLRRVRVHLGELLAAKEADGVIRLRAEPELVADALLALGDGLALRVLSEPDRDLADSARAAGGAVRALID